MARRARSANEPKSPRVLDVCVHGQPLSAQSASRLALEAWKQRVRSACIAAWKKGEPPLDVAVKLQVTFYRQSELGDVDNLLKPIQDALQGIAYRNDRQVVDASARRRDIDKAFKVRYMSRALALAFSDGRQFVHIEVWCNPDQETIG